MNEEIRQEILNRVPCKFILLIGLVASKCNVYLHEVTGVMWEMVDEGILDYGADAVVRKVSE